ncbi:MAG: divalent-cation tolerance protein CutA [Candidatus Altiarchaeota archaeon]
MAFIEVHITYPDMGSARKAADGLLKKRLIACANLYPVESAYWWKGKIEESKEILAVVKTRKELWTKLKAEVERTHPYEVPCIIAIEAEANDKYEDWINHETKN